MKWTLNSIDKMLFGGKQEKQPIQVTFFQSSSQANKKKIAPKVSPRKKGRPCESLFVHRI